MAISRSAIGTTMAPVTTTVERGRLAFFARTIGETNPIYSDATAARDAGHPDIPIPVTFFFSLLLEAPDPLEWIAELGIDMRQVLHGTQSFTYHRMAYAGDELTVTSVISDVYEKRGGALEFLVRQTEVVSATDEPVATLQETLVVRHPELEAAK
jgi:acyl dehydratase